MKQKKNPPPDEKLKELESEFTENPEMKAGSKRGTQFLQKLEAEKAAKKKRKICFCGHVGCTVGPFIVTEE